MLSNLQRYKKIETMFLGNRLRMCLSQKAMKSATRPILARDGEDLQIFLHIRRLADVLNNRDRNPPCTCTSQALGVECINMLELIRRERWTCLARTNISLALKPKISIMLLSFV